MSRPRTSSGLSEELSTRASNTLAGRRLANRPSSFLRRKQAALGLLLERQVVVPRAADRAEQHGIGGLRLGHDRVGERRAVAIVAGAADQGLVGLEADALALGEPVHDPPDLGHDLGADAVARQQQHRAERRGVVAQHRHHATSR